MGKKITIIGGGSSTFVPYLMRLFMQSPILKGSTITLMDVNTNRLEVMDTLARRLVEREAADITIRSTNEQRTSLAGADFVIVAISVGGMAAWEDDIEIPARYGVYMPVADSIGPGGIMRAFRHVPVLASICKDLEDVSPDAWVLNYTNPATANALAMRTPEGAPTVKSISLCSCSGLPRDALRLAAMAGVAPEEIVVPAPVAGLNHCAAVVDLRLTDGRSALPLIRRRSTKPIVNWVLDTYGILPYCVGHWAEFYPQLLRLAAPYTGRLQGLAMQYGLHVEDMDHERTRVRQWQEWGRSEGNGEVSLETLPADEVIEVVEVIEAIVENRNALHIVNTVNHGAIDNLPADAVVEVTALVGAYGIRPVHVGPLPEPIAANLRHHITTQQLTVQAALSGDRQLALQAFLLDPLLTATLEPEQTALLLDEMLQAHAQYLPHFA